jgi:hypothetical protein
LRNVPTRHALRPSNITPAEVISANPSPSDGSSTEPGNAHGVEHYWLCSRCARIYTLVHVEDAGVLLKPLWTEELIAETLKSFAAA